MFTTLIGSKLAALGVAGVLTLGAVGGGVAYAHQNAAGNDLTPAAIQMAAQGKLGIFKGLMADIIKQSGLPKSDFKAGFKNGQSVSAILTANGKNPADVEAAVEADVNARIQQALTDGKITQDQAARLTANVKPNLDRLFASQPKGKVAKIVQLGKQELDVAAQAIGIDTKTLVQDLRNGQTIAQVAGDKTPAVTTAITSDLDAKLDQALKDGKITQAQHDKLEANVPARVTRFVNDFHLPRPSGLLQIGRHELDVAAQAIGIDTQTLVQDLRNGQTIAQVAGSKTEDVINAITADLTAKLNQSLANLPTRVTNFVNNPHTGHPKSGNPAPNQH